MPKTNTLTSHHPESCSKPVQKMSSLSLKTDLIKPNRVLSGTRAILKSMSNKKRRQLFKQSYEEKI